MCFVLYFLLHGIFFFTGYQWAWMEVTFCSWRVFHRNSLDQHSDVGYVKSDGTAFASWALIAVLLPKWVLQQEGASLRCWSRPWFSVSTSIKGRRVPLLFVWDESYIEKGFSMFPGRAWDCQSSPKLDCSNMVTFEINSVSSGVLVLARYSVCFPISYASVTCFLVLLFCALNFHVSFFIFSDV